MNEVFKKAWKKGCISEKKKKQISEKEPQACICCHVYLSLIPLLGSLHKDVLQSVSK